MSGDQGADAGDAGHDQHDVGDGAHRDDRQHVPPRMPWRNTNAFCAPIATIRVSEARKPRTRGELMMSTVGNQCSSVQLMILHLH